MNGSIVTTASELAALLRLLATAHRDLKDPEAQVAVCWLLPVAARMADDIALVADELESAPVGRAAG